MKAEGRRVIRLGIVDDHPVFRLGLRRAMDRNQRLVVAWDLGDATRLNETVAANAVDLVLLDLSLGLPPDGLAATRSLLRSHPTVKVVILTGSLDAETASAARKAGAHGYILKDMAPPEMVAAIERVASAKGSNTFVGAALHATGGASRNRVHGAGGLTRRQYEVLEHMKKGRTNREIAARLGVSIPTVNKHVQQVLQKLNVRNRSEAIVRMAGGDAGQNEPVTRRDRGRVARPRPRVAAR
jgi:DNA-binding NarL/FixJ family response regulator